jgi:hypothetical protein
VLALGAACDRALHANRCGAGVCIDGADPGAEPACTNGVPVLADGETDNDSCDSAAGLRSADFVFEGQIGANDQDVVALAPQLGTTRIVVSAYGPGGTCPVDLALDLAQGECEAGGLSSIASSTDDGIGSCPYLDVPMQGGEPYWITVSRAANEGSGSYTMVVDFIP